MREFLACVVRNQVSQLSELLDNSNQKKLSEEILDELSRKEHALLFKITNAIKNMNLKLQREITNFINLKMKISLCRRGLDKAVELAFDQDSLFE